MRVAASSSRLASRQSFSTTAAAAMSKSTSSFTTHVTKIPGRSSLPEDATSNPHHVIKNGTVVKFKNPYPSWKDPQILRHFFWPQITGKLKSPKRLPPPVNVIKPEFLPDRFSATAGRDDNKIRATWLGHACYYVEYPSGLRVLYDPVFEDCCSPFPVSLFFPKRYTKQPCEIKDIPIVDAVVISHSHYDHLSHPTAMEIQQHHPKAQFFVGLGLEKWFRKQGIDNVTELDWWEEADLTVKVKESEDQEEMSITARISCLPCQHTSARSAFDKDTTLWCSWGVRSSVPNSTAPSASENENSNESSKSVWFGGDTGYRAVPAVPAGVDDWGEEYAHLPRCPQFKQIGDLRGPFDLGLIPIGAYHPRAAFSAMHANPFDAVEIFRDTCCKRAMGIHWGTWALTTEDMVEPPKLLREALRRRGIPEVGVFDVCEIGESRHF